MTINIKRANHKNILMYSEGGVVLNTLKKPIVAPSANPEGQKPAAKIQEAKNYFGDKVDFYVDSGSLAGAPSTLIILKGNKVFIKRPGSIRMNPK